MLKERKNYLLVSKSLLI